MALSLSASVDAPPAKRRRLSDEDDSSLVHQQRHSRLVDKPASKIRPQKCADFAVSHLEDFYKSNPPFRQPIEVGSFSFDSHGHQQLDRSELRWYSPAGKFGMDLKVGYGQYRQKLNQAPDLTNILIWMSHNWTCFLPKVRGQGSVESEHQLLESDSKGCSSSSTPAKTSENK